MARKNPAAVVLGRKGGRALAKDRGPEYFAALQAKRENRTGGRPRKFAIGDRVVGKEEGRAADYRGKKGTVTGIDSRGDYIVRLDGDGKTHHLLVSWIERLR